MDKIILIPLVIVLLWIFVKEPGITGLYKTANIYGRLYAYVAFAFMAGGIASLSEAFSGKTQLIMASLFALIIGGFMYYRVYTKSPDFLKKRCLLDLTISGIGTALRVTFFFLGFFVKAWWEANKPKSYSLDDGTEVYVYPDDRVYNPSTGKYGRASDNRQTVIWDY